MVAGANKIQEIINKYKAENLQLEGDSQLKGESFEVMLRELHTIWSQDPGKVWFHKWGDEENGRQFKIIGV